MEHSSLNGIVSRPQFGAWYVNLNDADINWGAFGAAFTVANRLELSAGYELVNARKYGDSSINKYNIGAKLRLLDENAFDTSWVPAIAVGGIYKYTDSRTVDALKLVNDKLTLVAAYVRTGDKDKFYRHGSAKNLGVGSGLVFSVQYQF